jgi:lactoylglutathione lyase
MARDTGFSLLTEELTMTMVPTIGSVPVFVSDQNRALEFYRDKLGFEIVLDKAMAQDVRWLVVAPFAAQRS